MEEIEARDQSVQEYKRQMVESTAYLEELSRELREDTLGLSGMMYVR